ncbi:hypothetical protein CALCODRAFT_504265 [Calocera cornea HHB12733]|uniref:Extracellular membrane protein CFEM domain-containing protein n=1 Tax=Calocera cornea HHB12733 TaxID=1353952 RepID=A0A165CI60_9BASI|nr:hypothetical protein CALCODRAFT_504265 [Calocera cornea HHB12733]
MRPTVLLPLAALPLLALASPAPSLDRPLHDRQAAAPSTAASCASGWQCALPSDTPLTARLSACASTDLTCLCSSLPALSPTCFECFLAASELTYDQYVADCNPFGSSTSGSTVKATGTGNVILGGGANSTGTGTGAGAGGAPTSLAKSAAVPLRPGWTGVGVTGLAAAVVVVVRLAETAVGLA